MCQIEGIRPLALMVSSMTTSASKTHHSFPISSVSRGGALDWNMGLLLDHGRVTAKWMKKMPYILGELSKDCFNTFPRWTVFSWSPHSSTCVSVPIQGKSTYCSFPSPTKIRWGKSRSPLAFLAILDFQKSLQTTERGKPKKIARAD